MHILRAACMTSETRLAVLSVEGKQRWCPNAHLEGSLHDIRDEASHGILANSCGHEAHGLCCSAAPLGVCCISSLQQDHRPSAAYSKTVCCQ